MTYQTIILEKKDHVARLTLNRPDSLNALNRQMFGELNSALEDVAGDREMRALVLTGAGRAFCASADIKEERQEGDRLLGYMEPNEIYQFIRSGPQGITLKLHRMEIPTIAMVNGLAIGDGFDFVLACDIRVGCERSRFMNAFLQMGLVSNTGATWLYPRAMGVNRALELLYTGDLAGSGGRAAAGPAEPPGAVGRPAGGNDGPGRQDSRKIPGGKPAGQGNGIPGPRPVAGGTSARGRPCRGAVPGQRGPPGSIGSLPGRAGTKVQGPVIIPSPSGGGLGWGRNIIGQNAPQSQNLTLTPKVFRFSGKVPSPSGRGLG